MKLAGSNVEYLKNFQEIINNLEFSKRKQFSPHEFCASFKDMNNLPINIK